MLKTLTEDNTMTTGIKRKTQLNMFYDAQRHNAIKYQTFLDMVSDPVDPLTKRDLRANIKRNPTTWKCFEHWLDGDKLAG
jgi:hypothetical protein